MRFRFCNSKLCVAFMAAALVASCARVDLHPDYHDVACLTVPAAQRSIDRQAHRLDEPKVKITTIPHGSLTLSNAISLTVWQNTYLQAEFEKLGVSKSDVLQTRLLSNPYLSIEYFPNQRTNPEALSEFDLTYPISDLWLKPKHIVISQLEHEQAKVEMAKKVAKTIAELKSAFVEYWSLHAKSRWLQKNIRLKELALAEVKRESGLGTADKLAVMRTEKSLSERKLSLQKTRMQIHNAYRKILFYCNLDLNRTDIKIGGKLQLPYETLRASKYWCRAQRANLDLLNDRLVIKQRQHEIGLAKMNALGEVTAGVQLDHSTIDGSVYGALFGLAPPVLSANQGAISKACYELHHAEKKRVDDTSTLQLSIYNLVDTLNQQRRGINNYLHTIKPLNRRMSKFALQQTKKGKLSSLELTRVRQGANEDQLGFVELLHDYWQAKNRLQLLVYLKD